MLYSIIFRNNCYLQYVLGYFEEENKYSIFPISWVKKSNKNGVFKCMWPNFLITITTMNIMKGINPSSMISIRKKQFFHYFSKFVYEYIL